MEKVTCLKNTLFYINQAHLTIQKGENILYADHFNLGQIILAANVATHVENCKCQNNEVKLMRPLYDTSFKGLDEMIGLLSVR